ncbi:MAG: type II secretion system F family protein, partial [Mesorhizobium sp.]|nr:type II secretion system F family protein [Mesorhizobium sp.]
SQNLQLVSLELRAGRSLDDALKALSDRLSLDEVRSFATLLQQSKELGTSLSGALRVFSDEMRHKRMSLAEEKAHALPAKMSVPVTVCILPVVLMIAIIPIIVKMTSQ